MTPYYADDWLTVHLGDCRAVMAAMEPESVHCVVTSPPYWGLRDYGTATWVGGDETCDHQRQSFVSRSSSGLGVKNGKGPYGDQYAATQGGVIAYGHTCGKCGAVRQDSQLGLEPTPEAYVESMVAVFREVRRVLRSDGTVWLNLGDSYAANGVSGLAVKGETSTLVGTANAAHTAQRKTVPFGLKPKDLVGIPWRVAFALQADGWYLRSDIIWSKPNPMPESVTDRPTKSHEYLFLLSKSPRYYFDADAVREPHRWQDPELLATNAQARQGLRLAERRAAGDTSAIREQPPLGREKGRGKNGNSESEFSASPAGRNIRSVWSIATQPYPGSHYAVFPQALVEPCIKAGTSERGVCPECGAPWERETSRGVMAGRDPEAAAWIEKTGVSLDDLRRLGKSGAMRFDEYRMHGATRLVGGGFDAVLAQRLYDKLRGWLGRCVAEACGIETIGWRPSCRCCLLGATHPGLECQPFEPVPATVLDPFAGSGTTGLVAQRLSRRAVLIDLNADYLGQVMDRNRDIPLGLGA